MTKVFRRNVSKKFSGYKFVSDNFVFGYSMVKFRALELLSSYLQIFTSTSVLKTHIVTSRACFCRRQRHRDTPSSFSDEWS